jgi:hypothetical protein
VGRPNTRKADAKERRAMVRSFWKGTLVVMLAGVGLAWTQQSGPADNVPATMVVHDNGKELRCRVISSWRTADGALAYQLRAIDTGEMLTLLEDGPATTFQGRSGRMRAMSMKIFHWGRLQNPPPGAPVPPGQAVVLNESQPTLVTVSGNTMSGNPMSGNTMSGNTGCGSNYSPCQTCDNCAPARTLRPGRFFSKSGDCNTCNTCNTCKTCDTCSPAPTRQTGCGCGSPASGRNSVASGAGSPYAPIAAGLGAPMINDPASGGVASSGKSNEDRAIMPLSGYPLPMPSQAAKATQDPQAPARPSVAQTGGLRSSPYAPSKPPAVPVTTAGQPTVVVQPAVVVPATPDIAQIPIPSTGSPAIVTQPSAPTVGSPPAALPLVPSQPVVPPTAVSQPAPVPAPSPPASPTVAQPTPVKSADTAADDPNKNWEKMWGSNSPFAKTKQPGQTLVDPIPTGKGPALPWQDTPSPSVAKNTPSTSKSSDPLLNPERYQPPAVERKMERAGVYVPRTGAAGSGMPVGGPALPLGTVSVLAAQNGMVKPVQFVPVPVPTVPQPWRAPAPPPPEIPGAPQATAYVNAFTAPRPQMPPQQPQGPDGAFTTSPNRGATAYGPMPYGPMPYATMPSGPMPYNSMPYGATYDPRMMAYGAMAPQGMYPPHMNQPYLNQPYMNQSVLPPSLSNPLPAYAYQQMAQGMIPQRPVAQVNYPATYQGPTPPNLVPSSSMGYYPPQPVYANPAMDRPGLPAPPPASNVVTASYSNSKVLYTLRESLYPAERETAVISLAGQDLRAQPEAVQTLVNAARHDPAGTVRAACVRCLARQQLNDPQVLNTFDELKNDQDPRVRLEVEQALAQVRR